MHEMTIAAEIQRISRDAVRQRGDGRIESVRVAVGELTAVEPRLLAYAWEALTAGGPDAGSRLEVDWRPARQFCAGCGEAKNGGLGTWLRLCPDCGLPMRVEGGSDLDVLRVCFMPQERGGGPEP